MTALLAVIAAAQVAQAVLAALWMLGHGVDQRVHFRWLVWRQKRRGQS